MQVMRFSEMCRCIATNHFIHINRLRTLLLPTLFPLVKASSPAFGCLLGGWLARIVLDNVHISICKFTGSLFNGAARKLLPPAIAEHFVDNAQAMSIAPSSGGSEAIRSRNKEARAIKEGSFFMPELTRIEAFNVELWPIGIQVPRCMFE